ncbi:MAG: SIS domain-containing protein [Silvanigrellaceae bacterium]
MSEAAQTHVLQSAKQKSNEFLAIAPQFKLGDLPTESQHPKTMQLSEWAQNNLPQALKVMREVDCDALRLMVGKASEVLKLATAMRETLDRGGRIYFVGCGATGRLSLSIEVLWREAVGNSHPWCDRVRSLMAGGDVALVRSIENFEDHPEFGARMLDEAGFQAGDLLVASTEGGETPYVIGAALRAPEISAQNHWFLFCNPAELLTQKLERCRQAILHPRLNKMNLTVGPMAISGSTRMQASTVLMLAGGTALFECLKEHPSYDSIEESMETLLEHYGSIDLAPLSQFIIAESEAYKRGETLVYETTDYGITVITDTTERSPTFSLAAFENRNDSNASASLCYLCIPSVDSANAAWIHLLKRDPRPLIGWKNHEEIAGPGRLVGYDFSSSLPAWRKSKRPGVTQKSFKVLRTGQGIEFSLEGLNACFDQKQLTLLNEHLLLKMILNIHSTLVMGRLGRYQGNVMTCVRPSNFKLIDRTIRYVQLLLNREGISNYSYADICLQCFVELETADVNEPIVWKIFESLKQKNIISQDTAGSTSIPHVKTSYETRSFSASRT